MSDQHDRDATTKAWTYAVLDALEAADEKTRLEIVRILMSGWVCRSTAAPPRFFNKEAQELDLSADSDEVARV